MYACGVHLRTLDINLNSLTEVFSCWYLSKTWKWTFTLICLYAQWLFSHWIVKCKCSFSVFEQIILCEGSKLWELSDNRLTFPLCKCLYKCMYVYLYLMIMHAYLYLIIMMHVYLYLMIMHVYLYLIIMMHGYLYLISKLQNFWKILRSTCLVNYMHSDIFS